MRLVEICVDGGLEATMYSAQAQLADAYIAAGAAHEARFIAEDLVAREPWEKANVERFPPRARAARRARSRCAHRRAAERRVAVHEHRSVQHRDSPTPEPPPPPSPRRSRPTPSPTCWRPRPRPSSRAGSRRASRCGASSEEHHFELSSNAIDLDSILGDFEPAAVPRRTQPSDDVEVDLSIVLDDIKQPAAALRGAGAGGVRGSRGRLREHARARSRGGRALDDAEKEYKRGLALRKAGDIDGCIVGAAEGVAGAEAAVRDLLADRRACTAIAT